MEEEPGPKAAKVTKKLLTTKFNSNFFATNLHFNTFRP